MRLRGSAHLPRGPFWVSQLRDYLHERYTLVNERGRGYAYGRILSGSSYTLSPPPGPQNLLFQARAIIGNHAPLLAPQQASAVANTRSSWSVSRQCS